MIIIKSKKEITLMREGGKILAEIMDEIEKNIEPGANTLKLDKLAEKLVFACGGTPAFKGFGKETGHPFPATICASINNEIVHSIPRKDKILKKGDLFKVDIGMEYKGLITDMARTFAVGEISRGAKKLLDATRESLNFGITKLKAGKPLSDYSAEVQEFVECQGFSVVRDLVGHGVGRELHEDPHIPNYKAKGAEIILKEGMTLALEPMVNAGTYKIKLAPDKWTYVTVDGKLSAHFEDTVLITKEGAEILTRT